MRKSGVPSRGLRYVPGVEWLEDRTTPDGNVSVMLGDQVLYVTGDNASNHIWIQGVGKNSVIVRSTDGTTTINGQSGPLFLSSVKEGYHVTMNGGDDAVIVSDTLSRRGLNVDMGSGNDALGLVRAAHRGYTKLTLGDGNDLLDIRLSTLRDFLAVDPGAGDDQVVVDLTRGKGLFMGNTAGTDYFDNRTTAFGRLEATGFFAGTAPQVSPPPGTPGAPGGPTDTTAPTAILSSSTADATRTGTIDFTATFSEDVTGFGAAGIAVTNGSVTSFTQTDARTYRFSVTPSAGALVTVTAQVRAGAATDAAGNANTASNTVTKTRDTATAIPTLDLGTTTDSGTIGDLRTDQPAVILAGLAEPGAQVTLFSAMSGTAPGSQTVLATAVADANGVFTFNRTLVLGPNSFVVRATDVAGNVSATFAQTFTLNAPPVVTTPVPDQTLTVGGGTATFDLLDATNPTFTDAEKVVRLTIVSPIGTRTIDINLFGAPADTVANFLAYVNGDTTTDPNADYNGTIFHRLVQGFVLQGGGFSFDETTHTFTAVTKLPAITNEPGTSNTLGTIAMARGDGVDSATSEFFFNLGDNSANLDTQNQGFTVFGQVMNGGLQTLGQIVSGLTTFQNPVGNPGAPPLPVRPGANTTNYPNNLTAADLATVAGAAELTAGQRLTFSVVGTSNADIATATVSGSVVTFTPGTMTGTATITIRATDLDGSFTDTTVTVNVGT